MFRFVRQSSLTSTLCYIKGGAVHSLNYSSKIGVNETLDSVMIRRRQWWYQSWVKVDSAPFSHELHVCILHTFIRCRVAQFCQKLSFKKLPGSRTPPRPPKFWFWTHGFQIGNHVKLWIDSKSQRVTVWILTFGKIWATLNSGSINIWRYGGDPRIEVKGFGNSSWGTKHI